MQENMDTYVKVRRQPNDYQVATYKLSGIFDLHWDDVSGGIGVSFMDQHFLYGYVQCDEAVEGEVAHSCQHGTAPHSIKICILKKDNKTIYESLIKDLPPKPQMERSKPESGNTCKKDIKIILEQNGSMRKTELIKQLVYIGHGEYNIENVLRRLKKEKILDYWKDPQNKRYLMYSLYNKSE